MRFSLATLLVALFVSITFSFLNAVPHDVMKGVILKSSGKPADMYSYGWPMKAATGIREPGKDTRWLWRSNNVGWNVGIAFGVILIATLGTEFAVRRRGRNRPAPPALPAERAKPA